MTESLQLPKLTDQQVVQTDNTKSEMGHFREFPNNFVLCPRRTVFSYRWCYFGIGKEIDQVSL